MIEITGDLWQIHATGEWIGITTNQIISKGKAVMGAGIALEAKKRFPELPMRLAKYLKEGGNHPYFFPEYKIVTIPTKYDWRFPSSLELIENSCRKLALSQDLFPRLYMPRLGTGFGNLKWIQVKPIMEKYLTGDNFIVVSLETKDT